WLASALWRRAVTAGRVEGRRAAARVAPDQGPARRGLAVRAVPAAPERARRLRRRRRRAVMPRPLRRSRAAAGA
ncbi:MAG: hypothetical protein AVDCRST_MAG77-4475, partial [uncultured Chloroflexi bacterium]